MALTSNAPLLLQRVSTKLISNQLFFSLLLQLEADSPRPEMTEGDNGSGEAGSEGGGTGGAMNLSASSRPSSAPAPAQNGDVSGSAGMEVDLAENRVSCRSLLTR